MSASIKFESPKEGYHFAFITKKRIRWDGKPFEAYEAVRAIKEKEHYRIDHCGSIAGSWMPWEAIDSVEYPTLQSAKKAIKEYVNKNPEE